MAQRELEKTGLLKLAERFQDLDSDTILAVALIRLPSEDTPDYDSLLEQAITSWSLKNIETDTDVVYYASKLLKFWFGQELHYKISALSLDPRELLTLVIKELDEMPENPDTIAEREILKSIKSYLETFIAGMRYQHYLEQKNK